MLWLSWNRMMKTALNCEGHFCSSQGLVSPTNLSQSTIVCLCHSCLLLFLQIHTSWPHACLWRRRLWCSAFSAPCFWGYEMRLQQKKIAGLSPEKYSSDYRAQGEPHWELYIGVASRQIRRKRKQLHHRPALAQQSLVTPYPPPRSSSHLSSSYG